MTPESIRVVSKLRSEFYTSFAAAMNSPVKISGSSYNSICSIASWVDDKDRLNYIHIYAYTAPDHLITERPFILRMAINKGAGSVAFIRQRQACQGLNQRWQFDLTVLPEELLDFLPWVVGLAQSRSKGAVSFTQEPPHPVTSDLANLHLSRQVWTQKAEEMASLAIRQYSVERLKEPSHPSTFYLNNRSSNSA